MALTQVGSVANSPGQSDQSCPDFENPPRHDANPPEVAPTIRPGPGCRGSCKRQGAGRGQAQPWRLLLAEG